MIDLEGAIARQLQVHDAFIDRYGYDEEADVLYLCAGPPRQADDDDDSLEGDIVFFDADGRVNGITIIGAHEMLDRDGELRVTLPSRNIAVRWPRELVEPLLHETLSYA